MCCDRGAKVSIPKQHRPDPCVSVTMHASKTNKLADVSKLNCKEIWSGVFAGGKATAAGGAHLACSHQKLHTWPRETQVFNHWQSGVSSKAEDSLRWPQVREGAAEQLLMSGGVGEKREPAGSRKVDG